MHLNCFEERKGEYCVSQRDAGLASGSSTLAITE